VPSNYYVPAQLRDAVERLQAHGVRIERLAQPATLPLEEFQIAASLSSPGDGSHRYLQCCNLLGHCFMQTGVPEVAVKWLTKGLNVPNISEEERMALTYELGAAYEQAGDLDHALESFTEVYGVNVSYRNVSDRLKMLKARLGDKARSAQKSEQTEMVN